MLEIRERNIKNELGHEIDYVLENGVELYSQDWNGEIYAKGYDRKNHFYIPVPNRDNGGNNNLQPPQTLHSGWKQLPVPSLLRHC